MSGNCHCKMKSKTLRPTFDIYFTFVNFTNISNGNSN